jgi:uncharacterized protein
MNIDTLDKLREIYDQPKGVVLQKTLTALEPHSNNFIEHSPFVVMSTADQNGNMDSSPRGGEAGFIKIIDNKTIIIPDAKGNNLLDSLSNIINSGKIGLIFFIPCVDETLRINGQACIKTDADVMAKFDISKNGKSAISYIEVNIEQVFLHCAKALLRSKLWSKEAQINRSEFPSMGKMIKDQLQLSNETESQDAMKKRYLENI